MAHIDITVIEQIAQALVNVPVLADHDPYTLAIDALRKRYAKRGIAVADFDDLLAKVTELAVATPFHDHAFILHTLDVLTKIPKREYRHIGYIRRKLDAEWFLLQSELLKLGISALGEQLSVEADKVQSAFHEFGLVMGKILEPVTVAVNNAFDSPAGRYLVKLSVLAANMEAAGLSRDRFNQLFELSAEAAAQLPVSNSEWIIADLEKTCDQLVSGALTLDDLQWWIDDQLAKQRHLTL